MLAKTAVFLSNAKYMFKNAVVSKIKSRDGMEMLQLVILIAIAITLGAIVFVFLNNYFQGDFWDAFTEKMQDIFDTTAE